jgi:hypothetical protein
MRVRSITLLLIGLLGLGLILFLRRNPEAKSARYVSSKSTPPARAGSPSLSVPESSAPQPPFATGILAHYAEPARPPEQDLQDVARVLGNFSLLVKGDNPLPLGANEEIAAALRGKNKAGLRALPDEHPAFNARGQLVDRWGSPLYFHAQSRDRLEIRSAGPDREMWTADDLHRKPDGRFLRGEALLSPSLFDEEARPR